MKVEWGNNNTELTITATDSQDKIFLSIIEAQVIFQKTTQKRVSAAQKKMHEKCNEVVTLQATLKDSSLKGKIYRFLGLGD